VLFNVQNTAQGDRPLLLHDEPVYRDGQIIGVTTSGGLGFRTGTALSMAVLNNKQTTEHGLDFRTLHSSDAHFQIRLGDKLVSATLLEQVPYDAERKRLLGK